MRTIFNIHPNALRIVFDISAIADLISNNCAFRIGEMFTFWKTEKKDCCVTEKNKKKIFIPLFTQSSVCHDETTSVEAISDPSFLDFDIFRLEYYWT